MTGATLERPAGRAVRWRDTTPGKKAAMAVTGAILFGFLIGHVLGNVQFFAGREKINAYSAWLHHSPGILWGTRILLVISVVLHAGAAAQLYLLKMRARPVRYARYTPLAATVASRSMLASGFAILLFVVYHILHLTTGSVHPSFVEGDVFHNLVMGFRAPAAAGIYLAAMMLLALHLYHGLFSMTQSIGVSHPRYTPWIKRTAAIVAIVLAIGFASIPIAVLAGLGG